MISTSLPPLVKVLDANGRSPLVKFPWSLPTFNGQEWVPGAWHDVSGALVYGHNGLHVTSCPLRSSYQIGCRLYQVEADGDWVESSSIRGDYAVRRARLLAPFELPSYIQHAEEMICQFDASVMVHQQPFRLPHDAAHPTWHIHPWQTVARSPHTVPSIFHWSIHDLLVPVRRTRLFQRHLAWCDAWTSRVATSLSGVLMASILPTEWRLLRSFSTAWAFLLVTSSLFSQPDLDLTDEETSLLYYLSPAAAALRCGYAPISCAPWVHRLDLVTFTLSITFS